ncbi:polyamine ABC transporter substrate-binding protein [Paraburkholderia sp. J69-2]|uniref:polyamine ABC transporter substrate-binding protein n=1 Tax=Paraburkholderia sp. J69-2 TaxID=2805437 RepID=UPI002AAFEE8E|nr:polyamine ABC transporter substrate-binding protein [Paraburkholderia sp. J69-2]
MEGVTGRTRHTASRYFSRVAALGTLAAAVALACASNLAQADQPSVNVYNWGNSIGKATVANFEKATGVKVVYQEFDSNETLQAKLLSGSAGYDVVVPSDAFWAKQLQAGIYQPLDKSKLPNYSLLDPKLMALLQADDPGNRYGIPWTWGTDGLGINVERVQAALGKDVKLDSLDLLFDPKNAEKLKSCGISMIDSPRDVFGTVLLYMKRNPNTTNPQDYQDALALLKTIRPYVAQFSTGSYIGDLAGGDICIALGWSGDVNTARRAALDGHRSFHIRYILPKEGSPIWFDVMAVPKDAPHPEVALKWINFAISTEESANLTNDTSYPSAVPGASKLLAADVLADPAVFPQPDQFKKLFTVKPVPAEVTRLVTRLWQQYKAN